MALALGSTTGRQERPATGKLAVGQGRQALVGVQLSLSRRCPHELAPTRRALHNIASTGARYACSVQSLMTGRQAALL